MSRIIRRIVEYDCDEMAARGRIGAHRLHATHDSRELTRNARAAFEARFFDEVDPERILPEDERNRRAGHARKAYFARLSLASRTARLARQVVA